MSTSSERFDADYYRRFYRDAPVHDRRRIAKLAAGVVGLSGWWGMPLRSVLEVGAGRGYWRDWFVANRPSVRVRTIDISPYACRHFGHEQADIATWRPSRRFDLVVCQGVLQYLDDAAARQAIDNLGAVTRNLLYLEVPTQDDRDHVLDTTVSDLDVRWRTGAWYRRRLQPNFVALGCGLHHARTSSHLFYELEHARS